MPTAQPHRRTSLSKLTIPLLAVTALAALAVAGIATAGGQATKRVVSEAHSEALGKTVLTNLKGRTLYSLSVEKHGRFVCTGKCLLDWHPLTVPAGTKPTGPVALGTVKRPEGSRQVTFEGRPLYTFDGDSRKGEANGEGFKDVGTWHAATPPRAPQSGATQPSPPESPGAYPGGY